MKHSTEFCIRNWCFYLLTFSKHDIRLGIEIGTYNIDISFLKLGFGIYQYKNLD
jgi:hypothetical protein